ncbi:MAG: CPBP family intramembrane glutamic endopeptidase [Syntrophomonas sp.]
MKEKEISGKKMPYWKKAFEILTHNRIFLGILTVIFLIPLLVTLGQYADSGFFSRWVMVSILFWPGVERDWGVLMPGWLIFSIIAVVYLIGVVWLVKRRTLGKVVIWGLAIFIVAKLMGAGLNFTTGWSEMQSLGSITWDGRVNKMILAGWHNSLWEELVFRGVPLLAIYYLRKTGSSILRPAVVAYLLVPAVFTAIYHIPNHGPARIMDCFVLGAGFAWLALRYSLFAPLVFHSLLNGMMIITLPTMAGIPVQEISWLATHSWVINTSWTLSLLAGLLSIPLLLGLSRKRYYKQLKNTNTGL